MTSKETICSGCGATVTRDGEGKLRDVSGSSVCVAGYFLPDSAHSVELPPVAIKPEAAPRVWFRETETLNFLYIARPDGRFWVVAMDTQRGDIYAIENSPAINPCAKPMAVRS